MKPNSEMTSLEVVTCLFIIAGVILNGASILKHWS